MTHEPEDIKSITCHTRQNQAQGSKTVLDCEIEKENGEYENKSGLKEIDINADIEMVDNPHLGEKHIKPNEPVKATQNNQQLKINSEKAIINGTNR